MGKEEGREWGGQASYRYKVSYGQTPDVKMGQKLPSRVGTQRNSELVGESRTLDTFV